MVVIFSKGGSIAAAGLSHWRRVVLRNADGRCGDTREPTDSCESTALLFGGRKRRKRCNAIIAIMRSLDNTALFWNTCERDM